MKKKIGLIALSFITSFLGGYLALSLIGNDSINIPFVATSGALGGTIFFAIYTFRKK